LDELVHAVTAAIAGETYISRNFASRVLTALRSASVRKVTLDALKLSAREGQIVRLLLDGKTNREMSFDLGITERTVKHYMTILMQKLNARNRVEAVIAAQNLGRSAVFAPSGRRNGFGGFDQNYAIGDTTYHS
jgi:DNA-binding NarL/FixJ family response regulator